MPDNSTLHLQNASITARQEAQRSTATIISCRQLSSFCMANCLIQLECLTWNVFTICWKKTIKLFKGSKGICDTQIGLEKQNSNEILFLSDYLTFTVTSLHTVRLTVDMPLAVAETLSPNKPNLDMTLAVAETLSPNKPNLDMTLTVTEALSPNKPNLDMTLAVGEALIPNKPNLDMTLAVAETLNPNKPNLI